MVTSDEPIIAPQMYNHQETPRKSGQSQGPGSVVSVAGFSEYDHLTSISQQRPNPQASPSTSNAGSCAPKQMSVKEELKERENWAVGSVVEVFSASASKWYIAQVVQVGDKGTAVAHMLAVQFVADNGQIMQKSMPRSDVQIAAFGKNTRQMPPNFTKVASESRPGEFSYKDTTTGTKYQTKELAWENYYNATLKCEQAQQLLQQQSLNPPKPAQAEKLQPASLKPPPTMSLGGLAAIPSNCASLSSDVHAGAHGPDPCLAQTSAFQPANQPTPAHHHVSSQIRAKDAYACSVASTNDNCSEPQPRTSAYKNVSTCGDLRSVPEASPQQRPQIMGSLPKSTKPFPG